MLQVLHNKQRPDMDYISKITDIDNKLAALRCQSMQMAVTLWLQAEKRT